MKNDLINKMENKEFKVIRVNKTEYELDNGDIYPHIFELDDDITIDEFQKILNDSKLLVLNHIKTFNKHNE